SSAREDSGDEAELALPADSQAPLSVRAALERELCEAASDTDTGAARGVLGSLKVAAAFDMSVYAASDIDRYRRNIPRLKRAMFDELKRYIDEEGEEDGDSDAMPAKGPVPKAAKGKKMDGRRTDETWQLVNTWRAQQQRLETRIPAQHSARTPGHTPESLSDRVARLEARAAAQAATISHLTHELRDAYGVQSNL
ncbi:hypothetical protein H4S01_006897, partial [Coemansia sp. RSA 2610]